MIKHVHSNGKVSIITDLTINLINNIKEIQAEKEISTASLAETGGCSRTQMSNFLNFKVNTSLNIVVSIIDALGYKIELRPKHRKDA